MSLQRVCKVADVAPGEAIGLELDGPMGALDVAIVRDEAGTWYAIENVCSHGQVALSDGDIDGCTIECWLHGSRFDLATGKPTGLPATASVPTYEIAIDEGIVLVDLDKARN